MLACLGKKSRNLQYSSAGKPHILFRKLLYHKGYLCVASLTDCGGYRKLALKVITFEQPLSRKEFIYGFFPFLLIIRVCEKKLIAFRDPVVLIFLVISLMTYGIYTVYILFFISYPKACIVALYGIKPLYGRQLLYHRRIKDDLSSPRIYGNTAFDYYRLIIDPLDSQSADYPMAVHQPVHESFFVNVVVLLSLKIHTGEHLSRIIAVPFKRVQLSAAHKLPFLSCSGMGRKNTAICRLASVCHPTTQKGTTLPTYISKL